MKKIMLFMMLAVLLLSAPAWGEFLWTRNETIPSLRWISWLPGVTATAHSERRSAAAAGKVDDNG